MVRICDPVLYSITNCFLWLFFTKCCRVYLHTLSRVSDSSLFIWHVVWHFQCRGPTGTSTLRWKLLFTKSCTKHGLQLPWPASIWSRKYPWCHFFVGEVVFIFVEYSMKELGVFDSDTSSWQGIGHTLNNTLNTATTTLHTSHVHYNYYMNWSYYCQTTHTFDTYTYYSWFLHIPSVAIQVLNITVTLLPGNILNLTWWSCQNYICLFEFHYCVMSHCWLLNINLSTWNPFSA